VKRRFARKHIESLLLELIVLRRKFVRKHSGILQLKERALVGKEEKKLQKK
jgi:hypothetical protein